MTTAVQEKPCRIDIRLTRSQRANYETAAALKGQTLSQWSTSRLDEAARYDIETARATKLSEQDFGSFCEILDKPLPKATQELLSRKDMWQ